MAGPFTIICDETAGRLTIEVRAFFDDATARAFVRQLELCARRVQHPHRAARWLIDNTDTPAQSQATAALIQQTVARLSRRGKTHVALVFPGAIAAMQVRRVRVEGHEMFASKAEALAWLASREA